MKKIIFLILAFLSLNQVYAQRFDDFSQAGTISASDSFLLYRGGYKRGAFGNLPFLTQSGSKIYATATGTDTYSATISPAITSYSAGQGFFITFTNANTGASTINLNSLGAKAIKKNSSSALVSGDIVSGQTILLSYDGTNFQVVGGGSGGGTAPSFSALTGVYPDNTSLNAKIVAMDATAALKEVSANKDASGGYSGLTLFKINFKNALNTFTSFFTNSNTASRLYTFQDRDGTIADNTDLAGKLSTSLASGNVYLGNGSGVASAVSFSGDFTVDNTGVATTGANKISYAKIQTVAANSLIGNNTGSTANAGAIGLGSGLAFDVSGNLAVTSIAVSGEIDLTMLSPTTTGYTSGDAIGAAFTIPGASLTSGGTGIIQSVEVINTLPSTAYRNQAVTATNATPCVFTLTSHTLVNGNKIRGGATGTLPTGFSTGVDYYIVNVTANTFQLSLTVGGTGLASTSAGASVTITQYPSQLPMTMYITNATLGSVLDNDVFYPTEAQSLTKICSLILTNDALVNDYRESDAYARNVVIPYKTVGGTSLYGVIIFSSPGVSTTALPAGSKIRVRINMILN